ncbi:MAG: lysophospholipid acyltransferase family protein [bacterium]|nr:lysophospholipid acyltransferase family protein [bacterium]
MFTGISHAVERAIRTGLHMALDTWLFGYNRVTYHRRERLREDQQQIIVSNHTSHYDAAVLLSAFPFHCMHRVHPVAAKDYFFSNRLKGLFFRLFMNVLPIERSAKLHEAFVPTEEALARGHSIIIFPEGTRSVDGEIKSFKVGVGYLSAKYGLPVLPVYIDGAHKAFGKGHNVPKAFKVSVVYGKPLRYEGDPADREGWATFAERLRGEIQRLQRSFQRARDNFNLFPPQA